MTLIPVQSIDLPQLLPYRTLRRQEAHKAEGIFVAEGEKVVERLLESGLEMVSMLVSTARAERLSTRELPAELPVYVAGDALLQTITGFRMHQGLMAVGRIPPEPELVLALPSMARPRLLAAFDGITQAENVGVTVRNCAAFDVQRILVGGTCCSPWLRRAVRSSMGGVFLVPVNHTGDLHSALRVLQEDHGVQVVVTDPNRGEDISTIDFRRDTCLVFGEEQSGVSEGIMSLADSRARIPMREGVDSLNVSSAGAVALYEVHRQRRMAPGSPASLTASQ
jgi:tRNA G18 (ribose-2'-O)-methylase SpoU